jgi:hypothetical protein
MATILVDRLRGADDTLRISSEIRNIMICGTDEFLLVLQKWINESATVILLLLLFQDDPSKPSLGGRLTGHIGAVDNDMPGFSFSGSKGDALTIDLEGWVIGYGADMEILLEPAEELFTLSQPGISMSLFVPLNKITLEH